MGSEYEDTRHLLPRFRGDSSQDLSASVKDAPDFQLGVLLVHGIGTQPPRDTLVRWGDALLSVIGKATRGQVRATVSAASPGDGSGGQPAEVTVELLSDKGGQPEKWLLSEGFWADAFPPPTYAELVSWSVRAVPWSIAMHISQRYRQRAPGSSKALALVRTILQLLFALTLTPVIVLFLGLTLVLGLLPIPQVRSFILATQARLTGSIGDSLAFVESPIRAALIRSRILERLKRLKARCGRTILIAHSQGAGASLDALGGIRPDGGGTETKEVSTPDTLLTFGAGTNPLVSLRVLARRSPGRKQEGKPQESAIQRNPALYAVALFPLGFGLLGYVFSRPAEKVLLAAGAMVVAIGIAMAMIRVAFQVIKFLAKRLQIKQEMKGNIFAYTGAALIFAITGLLLYFADQYNLPIGLIGSLGLVVLWSGISIYLILSKMPEIAAFVRKPRGVARWIDVYASADLVSNGPTLVAESQTLESEEAFNEGSMAVDHTTYWQNLDGFVLRVVRACADTARSPWRKALPPSTSAGDRRAEWRVAHLRCSRWLVNLGALAVFVLLWVRFGDSLPLPISLPGWLQPDAAVVSRFLVLAVLVLIGRTVVYLMVRWLWRRWVRSEQECALQGAPPIQTPWWPFLGIGAVAGLVLFLIAAAGQAEASFLQSDELPKLFLILMGWGIGFGVFVRWVLPAPMMWIVLLDALFESYLESPRPFDESYLKGGFRKLYEAMVDCRRLAAHRKESSPDSETRWRRAVETLETAARDLATALGVYDPHLHDPARVFGYSDAGTMKREDWLKRHGYPQVSGGKGGNFKAAITRLRVFMVKHLQITDLPIA